MSRASKMKCKCIPLTWHPEPEPGLGLAYYARFPAGIDFLNLPSEIKQMIYRALLSNLRKVFLVFHHRETVVNKKAGIIGGVRFWGPKLRSSGRRQRSRFHWIRTTISLLQTHPDIKRDFTAHLGVLCKTRLNCQWNQGGDKWEEICNVPSKDLDLVQIMTVLVEDQWGSLTAQDCVKAMMQQLPNLRGVDFRFTKNSHRYDPTIGTKTAIVNTWRSMHIGQMCECIWESSIIKKAYCSPFGRKTAVVRLVTDNILPEAEEQPLDVEAMYNGDRVADQRYREHPWERLCHKCHLSGEHTYEGYEHVRDGPKPWRVEPAM